MITCAESTYDHNVSTSKKKGEFNPETKIFGTFSLNLLFPFHFGLSALWQQYVDSSMGATFAGGNERREMVNGLFGIPCSLIHLLKFAYRDKQLTNANSRRNCGLWQLRILHESLWLANAKYMQIQILYAADWKTVVLIPQKFIILEHN